MIDSGPSARQHSGQGNKLDKVVLNLKKSAGTNQWNIDSSGDKTLPPAAAAAAAMAATEARRSRKSSSTPKRKLPIPAEKNNAQISLTHSTDDQFAQDENTLPEGDDNPNEEVQDSVELLPPHATNATPHKSASSSSSMTSRPTGPTSSIASTNLPKIFKEGFPQSEAVTKTRSSDTLIKNNDGIAIAGIKKIDKKFSTDLSRKKNVGPLPIKTFLPKDRPKKEVLNEAKFDVLPSLSNLLTMNTGMQITISAPSLQKSNNNVEDKKQESWNKVYELVS